MTATALEPHSADSADVGAADIAVIGGGPIGLYAAYCAGFRGLSVVVIDALPQSGGQVNALYPEKVVRDVAGLPGLRGRELVDGLRAQADTFSPTYLLGRQAMTHEFVDGAHLLGLDNGDHVRAAAVLITAGIGTFTPRALSAGEDFLGRGLEYFVPVPEAHAGRNVVIVGGGDSAVDWALTLAPIAASVTLVHRRERFRAHVANVAAARAAGVVFRTNAQVTLIDGDVSVECVHITDDTGDVTVVQASSVIAALGFVSNLGPLADWGLELNGRNIRVDQCQRTNLPGVYAAGDIADFDGKVRLMSVGFGEAATAVNNAAVELDPASALFPGHSTESA